MNDETTPMPLRTQRWGAYAVVVRGDASGLPHLLITRISPSGFPPGTWALPGGGIDHGESPHQAVVRELYEETGLQAATIRLVDIHDVHTVAPGRGDRYEDYHGVHVVYVADIEAPDGTLPATRIVDVGGSTDVATWLSLAELQDGSRPLLPLVEHVLARLDDYGVSSENRIA